MRPLKRLQTSPQRPEPSSALDYCPVVTGGTASGFLPRLLPALWGEEPPAKFRPIPGLVMRDRGRIIWASGQSLCRRHDLDRTENPCAYGPAVFR